MDAHLRGWRFDGRLAALNLPPFTHQTALAALNRPSFVPEWRIYHYQSL